MNRMPACGLYLITPDETDTQRLLDRVAQVITHASLLQYRNKRVDAATRQTQALALRALCTQAGVPLIINDDVELAFHVGADGVHLGQHDGDVAAARARLGDDAIIGASCYDSVDLARAAAMAGASYIAFGAVFASATKPHAKQASLSLFAEAQSLGVPRVAIGGIDAQNARVAIDAGADLLAVIGGVFDATDPAHAAQACAAAFAR